MKDKNSLENKSAFFAQYYGQDVFRCNSWDDLYPNQKIDSSCLKCLEEYFYLQLKRLSEITDEDVIEVAKLFLLASRQFGDFKVKIITSDEVEEMLFGEEPMIDLFSSVADFLRSRGYLLPFRNITTEELIQFGWARTS